jgi:integrase
VKQVARLVAQELLIKWLTVLAWRQRNVRECRIAGSSPNLFKAKIPPFSDIDMPEWVQQELQRNRDAEFWQFHFSPLETKTNKDVHAILPRQLISLLEEYLNEFRPYLVGTADPGLLFLNNRGNPMRANQVDRLVSGLTLRHGGRRVNPHLFRDIVAFTWLKEHPKDFLTLSKILWHSNVNTSIQTYGSRFDESSGVCAMDSWLDARKTPCLPA